MGEQGYQSFEFDVIETAENVDLQRRLAGIGSRLLAGVRDALLLLAGYIIILLILWAASLEAITGLLTGDISGVSILMVILVYLLFFALSWGYFTFFEYAMHGQTPGKKAQRIRVVELDGGPVRFTDVAIRNLLRVVDMMGFYALAGVVMFFTRRCQRLGDLAAGTVVVDESFQSRPIEPVAAPSVADVEAAGDSPLSRSEYEIVNRYRARMHDLNFQTRERLARKLLLPILKRHQIDVTFLGRQAIERAAFDLQQGSRPGASASPPPPTPEASS
jgi:uncharacterized RDD family membrane protein YckC